MVLKKYSQFNLECKIMEGESLQEAPEEMPHFYSH